ncbi:MAG: cytidine deaminase [Proteobacteria bacterium]|nr:cytidine deaminase [Pseudomonadota bacterium]
MVDDEITDRLSRAARQAAVNAYAPYSGFPVGAAALASNGKIYTGTNVENASFGLTACAERNAIFRAVGDGARSIVALAIFTPTFAPAAPCGACRQVLSEFGSGTVVTSVCDGGDSLRYAIEELLPLAFGPNDLIDAKDQRKRICVDIDNVVADTDPVMRSVIHELTGGRVDLRYKDITRFNYWECRDGQDESITRDEWAAVHAAFSDPSNLERVQPIKGVQRSLLRLVQRGYVLHFATSRLPQARAATIRWLEAHGFPPHDVHFLKHGEKHVSLGQFAASVEDDPSQALAFAQGGVGTSFLMAHPWNESVPQHSRLKRVHGWDDIVAVLTADSGDPNL